MVFIDGTNLFYRLEAAKLRLTQGGVEGLCVYHAGCRDVVRLYLYTTEPHIAKAVTVHGAHLTNGIRVVLGDAVPAGGGNVKEKGVDAMLVADLVYHAAARNYDYAVLISVDTDFAQALRRVEDFGCRTAVVAVCAGLPKRLEDAADAKFFVDEQLFLSQNWAARV